MRLELQRRSTSAFPFVAEDNSLRVHCARNRLAVTVLAEVVEKNAAMGYTPYYHFRGSPERWHCGTYF
jgi:hypothetical protein